MQHNNDFDINDTETRPSKTKAKRQMEDLQYLGMELVRLSRAQLAKFDLPDSLLTAIKEAQKITANGAIRRQNQYIGKLMRNVDAEAIQQKLDEINGKHLGSVRKLHDCEKWRARLLANDAELNLFVTEYTVGDINQLRTLIRQVRKELQQNKSHNYRKLFQFIREIIDGI
jgi:ribosome-associated protein